MTQSRNRQQQNDAVASVGFDRFEPPAQARAPWLVAGFLLFAVWLFLAWPWISGAVTIPWDARAHFHAQIVFLAQSLHRGESPFWAPYVFGGHPQIADPQSLIFSPPHLLLALVSPDPSMRAVDTVSFLSLLFGGIGVLGFARDRQWHLAAGLVASLAFTFGGSAAWRVQHTGQIFSMIYFPWALWMLERSLRLGSKRYGALAGFFAALIALDPDQVAFLTLVVLGFYVIAYWFTGQSAIARIHHSLKPVLTAGMVGVLIIAIPTLMVLHFAGLSNRPHFTIAEAELGSVHPSALLTFLIANLFGTIGPVADYWGAPSVHWPYIVNVILARNMANFYMGVLPFLGIVAWFVSREALARRFLVLSITFLMMLLYALGKYTPVFGVLYHSLPGVELFRRPADALFLVGSLGAFLAGFGVNRLLMAEKLDRTVVITFAALIALAFGGGIGMAIWMGKLNQSGPDILIAAGFIAASLFALFLARRYAATNPALIAGLFALLLAADFGWNMRPNDSTGLPTPFYSVMESDTGNATIRELKARIVQNETRRDRVELTGLGFEWPNLGLIHRFENTLGYNPLRLRHFNLATGAGDTVAGVEQHRFAPLFPSYRSPFANLMGLRFIALPVPIEVMDPRLKGKPLPLVARTVDGYIYENPDTLPRVMIAPRAEIIDQDILLRFGEWPSTDLTRIAYIEKTTQPLPDEGAGGTARIRSYRNTEIIIETDAPRGGVLLLNDVWHPWWFAKADGKNIPVLRANGAFRAVILPPGTRELRFRFQPMRGLWRDITSRSKG
ncbi:MAG: hypothetical protein ACRDBL_04360 [Rhabdaerophilum sp.]